MFKFDGARLASQRIRRGMFQRELGVRIGIRPGIAQQTVSSWERNRHVPEANTLPLLAMVLECSISDFYTAATTRPAATSSPSTEETTPAGAV